MAILQPTKDRASVAVLQECIELQRKKGEDYNSSKSSVKQADYYRKGLSTIFDIMWAKTLRMKSVLEAHENDPTHKANFESLEDSAKDLINYASFFVAYSRGQVDGQVQPAKDSNAELQNVLKTSVDWLNSEEFKTFVIIDPDGWDRKNFQYSFNREAISRDEFIRRLQRSTIGRTTQ